jgi:UTP--glucose-1-phosphate uridylyltransferase
MQNKDNAMRPPIRKLILPVAGLGKRLEPLTAHTPKNLLPVCGKPILDYVLDEIAGSGIEEVVFIISPEHRAQFEQFAEGAARRFLGARFHIREQERPLGHGHALQQAADIYKEEPVLVRFSDDIIAQGVPTLPTMLLLYERYGKPLLLLKNVPRENTSRYGIVEAEAVGGGEEGLYRVTSIVEKPPVAKAPSTLASVGGYVLTSEMLAHIPRMMREREMKNDALLIPHIFSEILKRGGEVYGWEHPGIWLDCGTIGGYAHANEFLQAAKEDDKRQTAN